VKSLTSALNQTVQKVLSIYVEFSIPSALTIHRRTHTGEKPYKCPEDGCEKRFADSSNLSKHLRVHTKEKPFQCPQKLCDKKFARSGQAARHAKVHRGVGGTQILEVKPSIVSAVPYEPHNQANFVDVSAQSPFELNSIPAVSQEVQRVLSQVSQEVQQAMSNLLQ
jgi:hypothetical protein